MIYSYPEKNANIVFEEPFFVDFVRFKVEGLKLYPIFHSVVAL